MAESIFNIIALFFISKIITKPGLKKIDWVLAGMLFIPKEVKVFSIPYIGSFPKLMIYTLLLTIILSKKNMYKSFHNNISIRNLLIILSLFLCIGFADNEKNLWQKVLYPLTYFTENFLVIWICSFYVEKQHDLIYIYKRCFTYLFIISIYGVVNYVLKYNIYSAIIASTYNTTDFGNYYLKAERSRISSLEWHPIYYGFILSVGILMLIYVNSTYKLSNKNRFYHITLLILLTFNLILVNSRTPILSLAIGLLIYYVCAIREKIKIGISVIAIGTMIIISFPPLTEIIIETYNLFTKQGSNLNGSSMEMRDGQLLASVIEFKRSPIFGNGFNYIFNGLGYKSNTSQSTSENDFYGFESYIYKLLIEQGIVGIIANIIFFLSLIIVLIKSRKEEMHVKNNLKYISFSMLGTFILFIFGTGDLDTFMYMMSILGFNIKTLKIANGNKLTKLKDIRVYA